MISKTVIRKTLERQNNGWKPAIAVVLKRKSACLCERG